MLRAIVIDDESLIIRGMKTMIQRSESGIEVAGTAEDGLTGLQLIRDLEPDIVFADISMPVMSGLQLIEICRREGNQVPFVILSGYKEFEYAKKAVQLDVLEYLVKPLNPVEFKEFLKKTAEELNRQRAKQLKERMGAMLYSDREPQEALPGWMREMRFTLWNLCPGNVSHLRTNAGELTDREEKSALKEMVKDRFGQQAYLLESRYPNEYFLAIRQENENAMDPAREFYRSCEERFAPKGFTMALGGENLTLEDFPGTLSSMEKLLRSGPGLHLGEDSNDSLEAVAEYLSRHFTEKIVLQDVAEKFGFNFTYFSYLFKKVYSQSPSEYITGLRMEYAKQLLVGDEEISVKEAALTAGYSDPLYFSRIFKNMTGVTPSEYRKQERKET